MCSSSFRRMCYGWMNISAQEQSTNICRIELELNNNIFILFIISFMVWWLSLGAPWLFLFLLNYITLIILHKTIISYLPTPPFLLLKICLELDPKIRKLAMIFCYTSSFLASTVAETGGYIQHQYKVSLFKVIKIKFKLGSFCFLLQLMRMYLCHQSKVDSSQQSFLHSLQKLQLFMKISIFFRSIVFYGHKNYFPLTWFTYVISLFQERPNSKYALFYWLIRFWFIHSFILERRSMWRVRSMVTFVRLFHAKRR